MNINKKAFWPVQVPFIFITYPMVQLLPIEITQMGLISNNPQLTLTFFTFKNIQERWKIFFIFYSLPLLSTILSSSDVTVLLLQYTCDENENRRRNAAKKNEN